MIFLLARIEDGDDEGNWHVKDHATKTDVPLRADRWFRRSDEQYSNRDFSGIRINIWNSAKVRRFLVHGGGSHNLGYHAIQWETITHGHGGESGKYAVFSTLPDKIARFLSEYLSYTSLKLPQLDIDRSGIDVHCILKPYQVWSLIHSRI